MVNPAAAADKLVTPGASSFVNIVEDGDPDLYLVIVPDVLSQPPQPVRRFDRNVIVHKKQPLFPGMVYQVVAADTNTEVCMRIEKADLFFLSGWLRRPFLLGATVSAAVLFAVPGVLAALRGRLYCTTLCPVGAALGIVSRFSPARIRITANPCTSCGRCARRCRAECITVERDGAPVIDGSSCVVCLECVSVCPEGALRYGFPAAAKAESPAGVPVPVAVPGSGRRGFLAAGGAAAVSLAAYPLRVPAARFLQVAEPTPVTPPGSLGLEAFTGRCTGCHLCVTACPTGVLRPSDGEYGAKGIFQPRMDYLHGYCDYDCTTCSTVCPNGAIRPVAVEDKRLLQIGVVTLYKRRCVVYLRGEECGACAELCPTHAAYTVERDGILYPETDDSLCIGCGACEFACPQDPKAIEVAARVVHDTARPPFSGMPGDGEDDMPMIQFGGEDDGEFPF